LPPSALVTLTPSLVSALQAHAARAYPEECCGALVAGATGTVQARELENVAVNRRLGFELSAGALLSLERAAGTLVGFYHSHPDGPPEPSARDAQTARGELLTVIVPVARGVPGLPRVFRFDERTGRFAGQ
jgi:proteasome lid subunit RPN8/RPN11